MARNVEIKAKIANPARLRELAQSISTTESQLIRQKDTFYAARQGRLKLREFGDGTGELIAYERPDQEGPKTSSYVLCPVPDPERLQAALTAALGVLGVVTKQRTLFMSGRTRIHLDQVAGLGDYMELEVVLQPGEEESVGQAEARHLMTRLEIEPDCLVQGAYFDLLTASQTSREIS